MEEIIYKTFGSRNRIYIDTNQCCYCGQYSNKYQGCKCKDEYNEWRIFFKNMSLEEFNIYFQVFYNWCNEVDDEKIDSMVKKHYSYKSKLTGYSNFLLKVHCSISHLIYYIPLDVQKYTQWVDSDNSTQRLISYITILMVNHPKFDKVFEKMVFHDNTNFWIVNTIRKHKHVEFKWKPAKLQSAKIAETLIKYLGDPNTDIDPKTTYLNVKWCLATIFQAYSAETLKILYDRGFQLINRHIIKNSLIYLISKLDKEKDILSGKYEENKYLIQVVINLHKIDKYDHFVASLAAYFGADTVKNAFIQFIKDNLDTQESDVKSQVIYLTTHRKSLSINFDKITIEKIDKLIFGHSMPQKQIYYIDIVSHFSEIVAKYTSDPIQNTIKLFNRLPSDVVFTESMEKEFDKLIKCRSVVHTFPLVSKFFKTDMKKQIHYLRGLHVLMNNYESREYWGFNYTNFRDCITFMELVESHQLNDHNYYYPYMVEYLCRIFCHSNNYPTDDTYEFKCLLKQNASRILEHFRSVQISEYNCSYLFRNLFILEALKEGDYKEAMDYYKDCFNANKLSNHYYYKANMIAVLMDSDIDYQNYFDTSRSLSEDAKEALAYIFHSLNDLSTLNDNFGFKLLLQNYNPPLLMEMQKVKPPTFNLYKIIEISIKCSLIDKKNVRIEDIIRYYNSCIDNLYDDIENFNYLFELWQSFYGPKILMQSSLFPRLYAKLPNSLIYSLVHNDAKILLEKEKYNITYPVIVSATQQVPHLPTVILYNIIHSFYSDTNILDNDKYLLSTVSKSFFDICSRVLSNHFNRHADTTYIGIKQFHKINVSNRFSLFKSYPKVLNFSQVPLIPTKLYEKTLYTETESLVAITSFKGFVSKITNLKSIQVILYKDTKFMDSIISLVKNSPLIEIINMDSYFDKTETVKCDDYIRKIFSLDSIHNLEEINVKGWSCNNNLKGLEIPFNIHNKKATINLTLRNPPISIASYECLDSIFFDPPELTLQYKLDKLDMINNGGSVYFTLHSPSLLYQYLDSLNRFHNIHHLSIQFKGLYKYHSPSEIQDIFKYISINMNHLKSFSLSLMCTRLNSIACEFSVLQPDQWSRIDLMNFNRYNLLQTKFYKNKE
ncbi:hypothetical protein DLAC_00585 [Tieghemostelium lacteum]|uniref:Uncharacterized protein n=1 Tax=Tieghemostelium lacteum TaxID=361077 RepID=A0A152AA39_TIELA|nr:hypothetical protein DLAC_00585 [Tieghemostelium lacteum]|eukprot:KYR03093.1 hypothetical protein DLAC_00585 [Tieghemostelium lacteum]